MANDITIINVKDGQEDTKDLEVCLQEESVQEQAKNARDFFSSLQGELDDLQEDLRDGLSYLDMKNDTLLSYMIDLCNIVLRKVRCDTISGHVSVERTVYYRIILEKIKAIDQRLAYQLNKIISMPDEVSEESQGVNVKNLDVDIESDSESEGDEDEKDEEDEFDGSVNDDEELEDEEIEHDGKKTTSKLKAKNLGGKADKDAKPAGIYRPPKLRAVAYNDGKVSGNSKNRQDHDDFGLGDDFEDDDRDDDLNNDKRHRDTDRTRYEEDNYTRLPDVNQKKAKRKLKSKNIANKGKKKFKTNKRKNKW